MMYKALIVVSAGLTALTAAFVPVQPAKPQVQTVSPKAVATSQQFTIPGRTEAYESATIFTRATGIVKERRYDIGDRVERDDVLAIIDAPEIDRAVESALATVDQAVARDDNARVNAERSQALLQTRAMSQEEADRRRADSVEAAAALRFARAELARMQEQQRFATVRAPFAGTIAGRNFDRGDRMRGDSATSDGWLYRLVRLDQLRFVIPAPPELALRLHPETIGHVRFAEFPGRVIEAKFSRASGVFDTGSGTMRAELLIENADFSLPAGLTGVATFEFDPAPGAYLIPANAIIMNRGQASLAAVDAGKVRMIPIALGRNLGTQSEVRSEELNEKTQVIVNPNAMLRAGDEVDVATVPPQAG